MIERFKADGTPFTGQFEVPNIGEVLGEFRVDGRRTLLTLRSKEPLVAAARNQNGYYRGVLSSGEQVSLFQCTARSYGDGGYGDRFQFATIFPHLVGIGRTHVGPEDAVVRSIQFTIEDAKLIFYDFDAFASRIGDVDIVKELIKRNALGRTVETGEDAIVAYFAGRRMLMDCPTHLGQFKAYHLPSHGWGGPTGVKLSSEIAFCIDLVEPQTVAKSMDTMRSLLPFFDMIIGRTQFLNSMVIELTTETDGRVDWLDLYWSHAPAKVAREKNEDPWVRDVLLWAVDRPEEFATVLRNWVERQPEWQNEPPR